MKKTAAVASVLFAAPLFTLVTAQAAHAGTPPSCVKIVKTKTSETPARELIKVTNNCSTKKYIKVIWNNGKDSNCRGISVGATSSYRESPVWASYDKTVTC